MRHYFPTASLCLFLFNSTSAHAQAYAGPDTLICDGSYTMQGSPVPIGGSGTWILIAGCGTLNDPTSPVTLVSLCPGLNTLVWQVDDNGSVTSDTVDIGVVDLPCIPNSGPDQTITGPPFTAQLAANSCAFPATCYWTVITGPSIIADLNDPYAVVSGLGEGPNIFRWTCTTGPCVFSDEVMINAFVWTGIRPTAGSTSLFVLEPQADQLRLNTLCKLVEIILTDAQGRAMELRRVGSMNTWSTAHCASGFYIVRAIVDGQLVSHRFLLDH